MGIFDSVIDITHHSKRTQAGNLEQAGVVVTQPEPEVPDYSDSDIPQVVTVERAIDYYKKHATGARANLYQLTAKWLEQYHAVAQVHVHRALEQLAEPDETSAMFNPDSDSEDTDTNSVPEISVKGE